jgi:hypothetical protein
MTGAACPTTDLICSTSTVPYGCWQTIRCTTPAPFCAALPAGCTSCSCLPADVCQGHGTCMYVNVGVDPADRYVSCGG